MEKSLSRQAGAIQQIVTASTTQIQRAVDELARGSGSKLGSAWRSRQHAEGGVEWSAQPDPQADETLRGPGRNIINAARAVEAQNSKIDSVMETRSGAARAR